MTDLSGYFDHTGAAPQPRRAAIDALDDEQWERLLAAGRPQHLRAGDTLVAAGDEDRALYLLLDGAVRADGRAVRAPATLGIVAFFGGGAPTESLVATIDGEALRIGFDAFERLAARDPRLGRLLLLELGGVLAARLRALDADEPV